MYDIDYMLTHDIDWFFFAEPFVAHAASNQGLLPKEIEAKNNLYVQHWVSNLPFIIEDDEIEVNYEYIERRLQGNESSYASPLTYKRTFVNMAKKGLLSFDRDLNNPEDYIWIARPHKIIKDKIIIPPFLFDLQTVHKESLDCFKIINDKIILGK